ncbi:MAG: NAD(P)-binding protein [Thermodesulforhabdaceae bacterium]
MGKGITKINKQLIVVGGGIGGIFGAILFKSLGYDITILEAGEKLGGCASTFEHRGLLYNAGATTLPGFSSEYPMERLFRIINSDGKFKTRFSYLDPVCEVHLLNGKKIAIHSNPGITLEEINKAVPSKENEKFFNFVYRTTRDVLTTPFYFPLNGGFLSTIKSVLNSYNSRLLKYLPLAKKPALSLIRSFYTKLPEEFLEFFRAQNFIVAQTPLEKASSLAFILALGYNFTGIVETENGIGGFLNYLAKGLEVRLKCPVESIRKISGGYLLQTSEGKIFSEEVLLAIPFLEELNLFRNNSDLLKYFSRFSQILSPFSALVVYGKAKKKIIDNLKARHHLFVIKKDILPGTSGYVHLSFLDQPGDYVTFTASTHTPLKLWLNLSQSGLKIAKKKLEKALVNIIQSRLDLKEGDIYYHFSATPLTFKKFTRRFSLGGFSLTIDTPFWKIPNNFTPFPGLYLLGDNAFAGQGFMGISLGCLNLYRKFC